MAVDTRSLIDRLHQEIATLRALVTQQQARIDNLAAANQALAAENQALRDQLEQAQNAAAPQAAPFRRRAAQKVPEDQKKRPGRPSGHPGSCRDVPPVIDETVEEPLTCCPSCGGPVADLEPVEQFLEDIPPTRPRVTRIVTYTGRCAQCGAVCSVHPRQMSHATGAAKTQLGPRALALAAAINKQEGVTVRKTCRILRRVCGLVISAGGLVQALARVAAKVRPAYERLIAELRQRAAVFADETSWWVNQIWWLWVFTALDTTVYRLDRHRNRDVIVNVLGSEFGGMLVSDCLASYESLPYRTHKCIGHHLRAIATARKRPDTADPSYLDQWKLFFLMVRVTWTYRESLGPERFADHRAHLEAWCDRLLAEARTQPGDLAVQHRLGKRRGVLLGCLYEPAAEPTNNRAERALRPAVMARKLSCGNKTEAGAASFETLLSLAVTCEQRGHDFVSWLTSGLPLQAPPQVVPAGR